MPIPSPKALRRLIPALVVVAALGVWAAYAFAAPSFTVVMPDEERRTVDLAALDPEKQDTDTYFDLRYSRNREPVRRFVDEGWRLSTVLAEVGAKDTFKELTIEAGGQIIRLSKDQLNDVPAPSIYLDGGRAMFIRGSNHERDLNGHHNVDISNTSIALSSESSYEIDIVTDENPTPRADHPADFQVSHGGGMTGKQYTYRWEFGDGASESTMRVDGHVEHVYAEPGVYTVKVTATTPDGPGRKLVEDTADERLKVGEPKEKKEDQPGGGDNENPESSVSGTYGGSSGVGGSTGSTTSSPSTTTPSTGGFDAITSDNDTFPNGNTVEGALLANVDAPLSDATESALRAARTGDPDFAVPEADSPLPPAAWAGLGALALMGAGAGLESGRRPRLRWPTRLRPSALRR